MFSEATAAGQTSSATGEGLDGFAELLRGCRRAAGAPSLRDLVPRYRSDTGRVRVWFPDQTPWREVGRPGDVSRCASAAHFLQFIPGATRFAVVPVEDGFQVHLPDRDWAALGTVLRAGTPRVWSDPRAFGLTLDTTDAS